MQGAELLRDPDFAQTLERSPFQARDLPGLSSAVADTFDQMPNELKQQLKETLDELEDMPPEELMSFLRLVIEVEKDPRQYPKLVQALVDSGTVEPDEMPKEYDPMLMGVVKSIVGQALMRVTQSPQKFAKGGIVSLKESAQRLQAAGRGGDSMLAHITPREAAMLKRTGGSGTINPVTGLPEFKIWKAVRSVLKIGAQIVGTALLTPFVGPIAAGAIVGGVSTLLSGGSAKDALKSAVFGGLTAGITSGISSSISGEGFMSGFLSTGSGGGSFTDKLSGFFGGGAGAGDLPAAGAAETAGVVPSGQTVPGEAAADAARSSASAASGAANVAKPTVSTSGGISNLFGSGGFGKFVSDYKVPLILGGGAALLMADRSSDKKAKPSLVPTETGEQLLDKYPERYSLRSGDFTPRRLEPSRSQVFPENRYISAFGTAPEFGPSIQYARAGGHINGPGTGTSDSIPARLSDGEFVMTAKAVRGAGDGDRMKGARKMYEMMHKFERMA